MKKNKAVNRGEKVRITDQELIKQAKEKCSQGKVQENKHYYDKARTYYLEAVTLLQNIQPPNEDIKILIASYKKDAKRVTYLYNIPVLEEKGKWKEALENYWEFFKIMGINKAIIKTLEQDMLIKLLSTTYRFGQISLEINDKMESIRQIEAVLDLLEEYSLKEEKINLKRNLGNVWNILVLLYAKVDNTDKAIYCTAQWIMQLINTIGDKNTIKKNIEIGIDNICVFIDAKVRDASCDLEKMLAHSLIFDNLDPHIKKFNNYEDFLKTRINIYYFIANKYEFEYGENKDNNILRAILKYLERYLILVPRKNIKDEQESMLLETLDKYLIYAADAIENGDIDFILSKDDPVIVFLFHNYKKFPEREYSIRLVIEGYFCLIIPHYEQQPEDCYRCLKNLEIMEVLSVGADVAYFYSSLISTVFEKYIKNTDLTTILTEANDILQIMKKISAPPDDPLTLCVRSLCSSAFYFFDTYARDEKSAFNINFYKMAIEFYNCAVEISKGGKITSDASEDILKKRDLEREYISLFCSVLYEDFPLNISTRDLVENESSIALIFSELTLSGLWQQINHVDGAVFRWWVGEEDAIKFKTPLAVLKARLFDFFIKILGRDNVTIAENYLEISNCGNKISVIQKKWPEMLALIGNDHRSSESFVIQAATGNSMSNQVKKMRRIEEINKELQRLQEERLNQSKPQRTKGRKLNNINNRKWIEPSNAPEISLAPAAAPKGNLQSSDSYHVINAALLPKVRDSRMEGAVEYKKEGLVSNLEAPNFYFTWISEIREKLGENLENYKLSLESDHLFLIQYYNHVFSFLIRDLILTLLDNNKGFLEEIRLVFAHECLGDKTLIAIAEIIIKSKELNNSQFNPVLLKEEIKDAVKDAVLHVKDNDYYCQLICKELEYLILLRKEFSDLGPIKTDENCEMSLGSHSGLKLENKNVRISMIECYVKIGESYARLNEKSEAYFPLRILSLLNMCKHNYRNYACHEPGYDVVMKFTKNLFFSAAPICHNFELILSHVDAIFKHLDYTSTVDIGEENVEPLEGMTTAFSNCKT